MLENTIIASVMPAQVQALCVFMCVFVHVCVCVCAENPQPQAQKGAWEKKGGERVAVDTQR